MTRSSQESIPQKIDRLEGIGDKRRSRALVKSVSTF